MTVKIRFNPPIRPTHNNMPVSNMSNIASCVCIVLFLIAGLFLYGVV